MTETQELKKRVNDLEKVTKNFELEMRVIRVMTDHIVQDIEQGSEAHLEAARITANTIHGMAESYR